MPIYIAVEVARRELEGRLLLGLVAAERGHDVVLGKIPHAALLAEELNGWRLPPGIVHLKSASASHRVYARLDSLRRKGTRISVQDEEHGLFARPTYADFGATRFPLDAIRRVDTIFAWGPRDGSWLRETFSDVQTSIAESGSPRIDLWRPGLIESAWLPDLGKSYILITSSVTPLSFNPFFAGIFNARDGSFGPGFVGDEDPQELIEYDNMAMAYSFAKYIVISVRRLARRFPTHEIVFRPHHFEPVEGWKALLGEFPNLQVRADGPSRSWVRGASLVIFSASTLGLETAVAERPGIAFMPRGMLRDHPANAFGIAAWDAESLLDIAAEVLSEQISGTARPSQSVRRSEALREMLSALDGPLAADRIVDEWERMMTPATSGRVERIVRRPSLRVAVGRPLRAVRDAALRGRSEVGLGRTDKGPYAMEVEHKFPSLDVDALRADAARLATHLGRFQDVEIVQIGDREVLLRAAGR